MLKKYDKILLLATLFLIPLLVLSCSPGQEPEEVVFGPTYDVGEIIVNLADLGQARYGKAEVVLELAAESSLEEIKTRNPQIRDIVIDIFSSQESTDLLDQQGKEEVKKKIKSSINQILSSGKVEQVYFTTIVVQ
ncbi:MAG: flagellar basal body-associated FliL family protein [Actinomycetota bacterium]|jgi:flagellar FliL protein|nr:flagellar basal body-associated FliL family protein [Actinomycetota bacterium]